MNEIDWYLVAVILMVWAIGFWCGWQCHKIREPEAVVAEEDAI